MRTNYTSLIVALVTLFVVGVIGYGGLRLMWRITTALEIGHATSEKLLQAPTTPSPLDRVRADLEK